MFLLKLSLKNLARHRKRTLITAAIIAAAIIVFLIIDSLLLGLNSASYDNIINYKSSNLQIVKEKYWENKNDLPLDYLMTGDKRFINELKKGKNIHGVSEKLIFQARLNNGKDELPIQAIGIRSSNISDSLNIKDSIVEGKFFTQNENKAVLGKKLADLMGFEVGDYLTLLVRTKEDTFNTIDLEIAGLIHTPNPDVNSSNVYLSLEKAQDALNINNKVSHLLVKTSSGTQVNKIAANLENKEVIRNKNLKIVAWNELTAVSVMTSKQGANQAILGIILLIAAIGIINTVILSALERMEEIGMMKAMGLRKREIIISFIIESTGLGIIGGLIGCVLGAAGIAFMSNVGIDFASLYDINMGTFGIPIIGKIYGVWKLKSFFFVFAFSVVISMIASIIPAYWAANKNPVDAIYHR